jgi:hypothetical protein
MPRMGARASSERGRLLLRSSARAKPRCDLRRRRMLSRAHTQAAVRAAARRAARGPARTRLSGAGLLLLLLLLRGGALQVALLALRRGALQVPLLRLRGRACAQGATRCASERDASATGMSERAAPKPAARKATTRAKKPQWRHAGPRRHMRVSFRRGWCARRRFRARARAQPRRARAPDTPCLPDDMVVGGGSCGGCGRREGARMAGELAHAASWLDGASSQGCAVQGRGVPSAKKGA